MKETPIIMSDNHSKLILDGIKTQTRLVVMPNNSIVGEGRVDWSKFCWDGSQIYLDTCRHGHTEEHKAPLPFVDGRANEYYPYEHQYLHVPWNWTEDMTIFRIYPKYEVGDRLWVREKHAYYTDPWATDVWVAYQFGQGFKVTEHISEGTEVNNLTVPANKWHWRPSIHMSRWASRITLEITEVRVERLQEITSDDARLEGVDFISSPINAFKLLWDSLNAKRGYGWETNPWVWVIGFRRLQTK